MADDVVDRQRKVVYGERKAVLDGKDVTESLVEAGPDMSSITDNSLG